MVYIIIDTSKILGLRQQCSTGKHSAVWELDNMHGLNSYDYGARQYNPVTLRWDRMDPLATKYYSTSPYVYCLNNPVMLIDPDGRDIIPTLVTGWKGDNAIKKDFVSTKGFVRAMNLIGQTSYGKHIVSSFLPKGKMQYGVSGQGQYSEYILQFTEANCASASDQEDVLGRYVGSSEVYGTFGFDEFGNGDNKGLQYEITIDVKRDFADMLVTMVHEIALHGSAIDAINQAYQEGGIDKAKELWKKLAADDHKNLKNHNSATNDYKTYESMMKELIKLDPSLESAFKRADQRAQKQY